MTLILSTISHSLSTQSWEYFCQQKLSPAGLFIGPAHCIQLFLRSVLAGVVINPLTGVAIPGSGEIVQFLPASPPAQNGFIGHQESAKGPFVLGKENWCDGDALTFASSSCPSSSVRMAQTSREAPNRGEAERKKERGKRKER